MFLPAQEDQPSLTLSLVFSAWQHPAMRSCIDFIIANVYRVGQIKRGQLIFFLVTSERIYKIK